MRDDKEEPHHWVIYAATTDAGSDETVVKDYMAWLLAVVPWALFFQVACWLHQIHLIMKTLLICCDVWVERLCADDELPSNKYFSNLATLSNCIREFSSKFRCAFISLYPDVVDIKRLACKIPPKCISGRWGAVTTFEKYVVERCWSMMHHVLSRIFGQQPENVDNEVLLAMPKLVDETSLDDCKRYKAKIGRWRKASLLVTASKKFRLIIESVHKMHSVLSRLRLDLMSTDHKYGSFLFMIWRGNTKYRKLFADLLARHVWVTLLERAVALGVDLPTYTGLIWWHVCVALVNYDFRLTKTHYQLSSTNIHTHSLLA